MGTTRTARGIDWTWDGDRGRYTGSLFNNVYEVEKRYRSPGDTPDTGWYLFGPDGHPFGQWMARLVDEALDAASEYVIERHDPGPQCQFKHCYGMREKDCHALPLGSQCCVGCTHRDRP